jgi:hypothetical protein
MPRKQRFKPSRKPKPIPQNEDAVNAQQAGNPQAHDRNADAESQGAAYGHSESSSDEPSADRSR